MKSNIATRFLFGCLMAFLPALPSSAVEARCQELIDDGNGGTTCVCSETFDFSWNNDSLIPNGTNNPPNSLPPYECNAAAGGDAVTNGSVQTQVESGALSGLGGPQPPNRVLVSNGGSGLLRDSVNRDFTGKTFCMRVYRRDDPASHPKGDNETPKNFKGMLIDFDNDAPHESPAVDMEWRKTGTDQATLEVNWLDKNVGYKAASKSLGLDSGRAPTLNDCSDRGYCSWEVCVDHGLSSTRTNPNPPANSANVRFRQCVMSGPNAGTCGTWEDTSIVGQSRINTGDRISPARFLIDVPGGSGWDVWVSHFMVAIVDRNENFWIGPAYEIEGGNSTPLPDPNPERPASPFLLD